MRCEGHNTENVYNHDMAAYTIVEETTNMGRCTMYAVIAHPRARYMLSPYTHCRHALPWHVSPDKRWCTLYTV